MAKSREGKKPARIFDPPESCCWKSSSISFGAIVGVALVTPNFAQKRLAGLSAVVNAVVGGWRGQAHGKGEVEKGGKRNFSEVRFPSLLFGMPATKIEPCPRAVDGTAIPIWSKSRPTGHRRYAFRWENKSFRDNPFHVMPRRKDRQDGF